MADAQTIGTVDVARSETLPIAGGFAALLGTGESLTLPTATIIKTIDGTVPAGALTGIATVVNVNQVQQIVACSALTVGYEYELRLTAMLATNKIETVVVVLRCVR